MATTIENVKAYIKQHEKDILGLERWIFTFRGYKAHHERLLERARENQLRFEDGSLNPASKSAQVYEAEIKTDEEALTLLMKAAKKAARSWIKNAELKDLAQMSIWLTDEPHTPEVEEIVLKKVNELREYETKEPEKVRCEYCDREFLLDHIQAHYEVCKVKQQIDAKSNPVGV